MKVVHCNAPQTRIIIIQATHIYLLHYHVSIMSDSDPIVTEDGIKAANTATEAFKETLHATATTSVDDSNGLLNFVASIRDFVKGVFSFFQENAWNTVLILILGWFLKIHLFDPWYDDLRNRRSYEAATDPNRTKSLNEDLRRIREQQQEEVRCKAKEAAEAKKKKKAEELEKKRIQQPGEELRGGSRLGGDGPRRRRRTTNHGSTGVSRSSFNPMDPSSSSTGGGYRPQSRNIQRGG